AAVGVERLPGRRARRHHTLGSGEGDAYFKGGRHSCSFVSFTARARGDGRGHIPPGSPAVGIPGSDATGASTPISRGNSPRKRRCSGLRTARPAAAPVSQGVAPATTSGGAPGGGSARRAPHGRRR